MRNRYAVFTDLDGTLLDHHNYDLSPALPAIERIKALGWPLIFNSSKTPPELAELAEQLQLDMPFIAENGALVALPDPQPSGEALELAHKRYQIKRFGPDYDSLCRTLDQLIAEQGFACRGFHHMSDAEVAEHTGLSIDEAQAAKQRQASEPLLWQGDDSQLQQFQHSIEQQALTLVKGGRFWHLAGHTDKGQAMNWLLQRFQQHNADSRWHSIALGDSPNDLPMLEAADIAVAIPPAEGDCLDLPQHPQFYPAQQPGPCGWNQTLNSIINALEAKEKLHG